MTDRPPIPSLGDNFRRLHPEVEAQLLREWLQHVGWPRPYTGGRG